MYTCASAHALVGVVVVVVVILVVLVCACMGLVRTLMPMLARDGRAVRLFARSLIRPAAARNVRVRAALTVADYLS